MRCRIAIGVLALITSLAFELAFELAFGPICIRCQIGNQLLKLIRLADEESVRGEALESPHRSPLRSGRANNRTDREEWWSPEEWAWLRHDQIGLQRLLLIQREEMEV